MSSHTKVNSDLFNQIFSNQFGYEPIRKKGYVQIGYSKGGTKVKLLKDEDVTYSNLNKLQIMGYIPYVVEVLENHPKPSFREVLRRRGTKVTSCSSLRTIYKRIGFIDYVGGKMVKGKNYDRFLTTKWDWFEVYGTKVLVSGERYSVREILWVNEQLRFQSDMDGSEYHSIVSDDVYQMIEDCENSMVEVYNKKVQWGRK